MGGVEDLMIGLEAALQTIPGLNTSPTKLDNVMPPHAIVGVPPVSDYVQAFTRGKYEVNPTITVFTSKALDRPGQLQLARFVAPSGPQSIPAAVHADPTLGGAVEDVQVVAFRPLDVQEVAMVGYWGGLFTLRAMVLDQPQGGP